MPSARRYARDAERLRDLVELLDQGGRERHAILLPIGAAGLPALSRDADFVDPGQPRRRGEIAHMAIHLRAELIERQEAGDIERDHELPGIGLARLLGIDVLDVAP